MTTATRLLRSLDTCHEVACATTLYCGNTEEQREHERDAADGAAHDPHSSGVEATVLRVDEQVTEVTGGARVDTALRDGWRRRALLLDLRGVHGARQRLGRRDRGACDPLVLEAAPRVAHRVGGLHVRRDVRRAVEDRVTVGIGGLVLRLRRAVVGVLAAGGRPRNEVAVRLDARTL